MIHRRAESIDGQRDKITPHLYVSRGLKVEGRLKVLETNGCITRRFVAWS
jgi:hypothetical protein